MTLGARGSGLVARRSSLDTASFALARFGNALYFLLTAAYCILTYSPFAYQQFIRPRLVSSLTTFIVWHPLWHWLALAATIATLWPERLRGRGHWLARTYVAAMGVLGVLLVWRPVLPSVENDGLGLRLAALFLIPPLWLAVVDHMATWHSFVTRRSGQTRLVAGGLLAAVIVWAFNLASAPLRLQRLGDVPLGAHAWLFGAAVSLAVHLAVIGLLTIATAMALRAAKSAAAEYWIVAALAAFGTWLVVANIVFASLSFRGAAAQLLAAELALALTAVWSGVCRSLSPARAGHYVQPGSVVVSGFPGLSEAEGSRTVLSAWFSPLGLSSRAAAAIALVILPFAMFAGVQRVATLDWNFLFQNLMVLAAWLIATAASYALVTMRSERLRTVPTLLAAGVLLTAGVARGPAAQAIDRGLTRPSFVPEFALDGYAAIDPSYRLIRQLLWVEPEGSASFYRTLRTNSLIQNAAVAPINVDFVPAPIAPATQPPPDIFLFIIDSLRRDYVAAYNPAVTFTPSLAAFAAEPDTFTFQKHFARYGGTGLAMPAIWAGGMVLHKEYVLPFAPMNALGKLLAANHYQQAFSLDHITAELVAPGIAYEELDRGREEMQYDFCSTLDELQKTLESRTSTAPLFATTRSLNLHVSKLMKSSAVADAADGFVDTAVAEIGRMDGCFGRFVESLKRSGRYGHSIVIVTSDHGDSLGEAMRWGHSYTLYPEIVRTPLLMHVPPQARGDLKAATDTVSFSTDLTPTLYQLLGYTARLNGPMYGESLFHRADHDASARKRESVLVASSYGAVYGLVSDDGRSLYVADGVNTRDYAYDLSALRPTRVGVTAEARATNRALIAERVHAIADAYHYTPAP